MGRASSSGVLRRDLVFVVDDDDGGDWRFSTIAFDFKKSYSGHRWPRAMRMSSKVVSSLKSQLWECFSGANLIVISKCSPSLMYDVLASDESGSGAPCGCDSCSESFMMISIMDYLIRTCVILSICARDLDS